MSYEVKKNLSLESGTWFTDANGWLNIVVDLGKILCFGESGEVPWIRDTTVDDVDLLCVNILPPGSVVEFTQK